MTDPRPMSSMLPPEGDLLDRARDGDLEARDQLARRHYRPAYLFALQLTGSPEDALDVSQEAMLRLLGNVGSLDRSRALRPWLFTVVRNLVRDLWRKRRVRKNEPLAVEVGPELGHQIVDREANPETDAVTGETRRRLWRALAALPAKHREILVLRDYHDLSYDELSQVLKIPLGTVMSRLHAARKTLRSAYLSIGGEVPAGRHSKGGASHA